MDIAMPKFLTAILAISLLSMAGLSHAADNGECATPEAMTEKLKAEDQHSFASAERVHRSNNLNTLTGLIFTVSSDRSVGYILESDAPTGERASKICVYNRLADLRMFDARKPGIPPAALLRASEDNAMSRCAELVKSGKVEAGTCGSLNSSLKVGEPFGEHVLFQGFNVEKKSDGSYQKMNVLTTVTATLPGAYKPDFKISEPRPFNGLVSGIFFSSLPEGATTTSVTLAFAEYTPYGLSLLEH
jgi:hypothetical protein